MIAAVRSLESVQVNGCVVDLVVVAVVVVVVVVEPRIKSFCTYLRTHTHQSTQVHIGRRKPHTHAFMCVYTDMHLFIYPQTYIDRYA